VGGHLVPYKIDFCIIPGVSASYVGVSETIVHFVIYEQIKAQLQLLHTRQNLAPDDASLYNFVSYLCAAACSKSCATTLCYPHEVVRTRLREEGTKYRTFLQTLKTVYYEESIAGLYRGLLTHLIRQIPVRRKRKAIFDKNYFFVNIEYSNYDEYI
jgi:solute carrier family 25 protein 33/36